jgi:hypothetical protein
MADAPVEPGMAAGAGAGEPPIPALTAEARRRLTWLAAALSIAIVAGAAGFAVGGASRDRTIDDLDAQVGVLGDATGAAIRIAARPDARHVALGPATSGDRSAGGVTFAPGTGELLVVATGLAPEPAGYAYWGWLESGGQQRLLGAMTWAGGSWSWSGIVDGLASVVTPASIFHVSLAPAAGGPVGDPVLSGRP